MKRYNSGLEPIFVLILCVFIVTALWVSKAAEVPFEMAVNAVTSFIIWAVTFAGVLYARFCMDVDILEFTFPIFAAALWGMFTPFLDYWANEGITRSFYQKEIPFFGEHWFQWGVSALILVAGYFMVFRMSRYKY
ncbi:hypothetical protein QSX71_004582 [Vibrio vulnificus]|uniref:hypothetical protein n=1 Tax=Vibrio vulnificus TaxID=672 RepID=UPI00165D715D|nr:hypothetical protein [Vibrio vulnificus]EGR0352643.1 hypothetical protein [Vibrio vulnificus]EGR0641069.1 hypothetical protein [Vibrio vulnificus]EGR0650199.1 hypothetical protein [Vibrio vulnificus]EID0718865.1 hypothetical protein [Vibrio vulnificus]EID0743222.1 hypothetical protein [Vibrio vulnificus]